MHLILRPLVWDIRRRNTSAVYNAVLVCLAFLFLEEFMFVLGRIVCWLRRKVKGFE